MRGLVLEFLISFRSRKNDIDPYSHGFWSGSHKVIGSICSFHAKFHFCIGRFDMIQMINVDFFDRLKSKKRRLVSETLKKVDFRIKQKKTLNALAILREITYDNL